MKRSEIKKTLKNLHAALKDELEGSRFYARAAEEAKDDGFSEAAEFFRKAEKAEKGHAAEIEKLLHERLD